MRSDHAADRAAISSAVSYGRQYFYKPGRHSNMRRNEYNIRLSRCFGFCKNIGTAIIQQVSHTFLQDHQFHSACLGPVTIVL